MLRARTRSPAANRAGRGGGPPAAARARGRRGGAGGVVVGGARGAPRRDPRGGGGVARRGAAAAGRPSDVGGGERPLPRPRGLGRAARLDLRATDEAAV